MRKVLGIALLLSPFGLALLIWFGVLAANPAVPVPAHDAAAAIDLERLQAMLRQQVQLRANGFAEITLDEPEVNQLVSHLLRQQRWPAEAHISLAEDGLVVLAALDTALPRPWLNARIQLEESEGELSAAAMTLGRLPVPKPLLPAMERILIAQLQRHEAWPAIEQAQAAIADLDITPARLKLGIQLSTPLRSELASRQGELLMGPAVQRSVPRYLAAIAQHAQGEKVPLTALLTALFARAQQATQPEADPVVENRALLLALTLHSVPQPLLQTLGVPELAAVSEIQPLHMTLHGRRDLAQHFLISALLASYGDQALATRAGLYKELRDLTTASGFDATDLLADYAGMAFGSLAASEATGLQRWMQASRQDSDLMPPVSALSPPARDMLAEAAATGNLATLEATAEQRLLPLLAGLELYQELP